MCINICIAREPPLKNMPRCLAPHFVDKYIKSVGTKSGALTHVRTRHSRKLTAMCRSYGDTLAPPGHPRLVGLLIYNPRCCARVFRGRGMSGAEICFRFCQHPPLSVCEFVRVLHRRQGSRATAFVVASVSCCAIDLRRAALDVSCCTTRCFRNAMRRHRRRESIPQLPVMRKTEYKEQKRCGTWKKARIETEGVLGKETQ